jgi:hypothetical protein
VKPVVGERRFRTVLDVEPDQEQADRDPFQVTFGVAGIVISKRQVPIP